MESNTLAIESDSLKKRSRTVPTTPMHTTSITNNKLHNTKPTLEFTATHETTSNFRNQLSKLMVNSPNESLNSSTTKPSLYWEGPLAHFMLPTHAIHCRLSRSVERCPRACKGIV